VVTGHVNLTFANADIMPQETCDLCIMGASIAGMNALWVAAEYLTATPASSLLTPGSVAGEADMGQVYLRAASSADRRFTGQNAALCMNGSNDGLHSSILNRSWRSALGRERQ